MKSHNASRLPWMLCLAVLSNAWLHAEFSPGTWKTDLSKKSISLSELMRGGPPKDGIPAIRQPKFVGVRQAATWLNKKEPVLVVELGGQARAYPLQILIWHELVDDQIGQTPILVSYCPLCNSGIVFDRQVDGVTLDFGVSGMLRNSDMVMYDRQTDSLWQQITGEAIVGTHTGKSLSILSSQIVSFETFSQAFPEGRVLSRETGFERRYGQNPYQGYEFGQRLIMPVRLNSAARQHLLERLVTVSGGKTDRAYPFSLLKSKGLYEDHIGDLHFIIFFQEGTVSALDESDIADSRDVGAVGVFSPELEGRHLSFWRKEGRILDKETSSKWNVLGIATEGPLAGKRLHPIRHQVSFAFAWLTFRPDTQIVGD
jgi:hypothetical protein